MDSSILGWIIPVAGLVGGAAGWLGRQYQYIREAKKQAGQDADKTLKDKKTLLEEMISKKENESKKAELQRCLDDVNTALLGLSTARVRRTLKEAGLPTEERLIAEGTNQLKPLQMAQLNKEINQIRSLPPSNSIQVLFIQAAALYYAEKYQEAKMIFETILKLSPDNTSAFNNHGVTLAKLEKYKEALSDINRSLEINPNQPTALNNRGNLYTIMGKFNEALADQNRSLELNPDSFDTLNNRGVTYLKLERYDEAIADFNHVLMLKPGFATVFYNLACVFSLQNKIDDALVNLEKAISINKKYREDAKTDTDFDNIRNDSRFKELIGE